MGSAPGTPPDVMMMPSRMRPTSVTILMSENLQEKVEVSLGREDESRRGSDAPELSLAERADADKVEGGDDDKEDCVRERVSTGGPVGGQSRRRTRDPDGYVDLGRTGPVVQNEGCCDNLRYSDECQRRPELRAREEERTSVGMVTCVREAEGERPCSTRSTRRKVSLTAHE